jgi:hypothetical protein
VGNPIRVSSRELRRGRDGTVGRLGDESDDGAGVVGNGHMAAAWQFVDVSAGRELVYVAGLVLQQHQIA